MSLLVEAEYIEVGFLIHALIPRRRIQQERNVHFLKLLLRRDSHQTGGDLQK